MVVGEVQYRNALPWGLVLVHVSLAAPDLGADRRGRLLAVAASDPLASDVRRRRLDVVRAETAFD